MRRILAISMFCLTALACKAQQKLISYDDMVYLITNNLQHDDQFMLSKGYISKNKKAIGTKTTGSIKYELSLPGGSTSEVEIRADGRRVYIYIATDEIQQVNLVINSIEPFVLSKDESSGILNYKVKDLGNIYYTSTDKMPYNPIKRDHDIRIVSDKAITTYN
ncbi:hypothetical protein LLH06_08910 [Mucilaginibacter daejeonensis]|uniref:hypothetical protein n=1 Tax=Mucilaginibacter daejeonensis TaxID=398049 RepID=UPI001D1757DA|nr:hypothetical protein [Mucilaginibacter daejeonensis]UEG55081.1 hypothetical protein LLH06_08910 [Mucilaginibacter daejeonensis]